MQPERSERTSGQTATEPGESDMEFSVEEDGVEVIGENRARATDQLDGSTDKSDGTHPHQGM